MTPVRGIARCGAQKAVALQLAAHGAYSAALSLVAQRFGVPPERIEDRGGVYRCLPPPGRCRSVREEVAQTIRARRSAIYLSVVAFDRSVRSIARASGMTPEGVRKALQAIEEARDDPEFDLTLTQLEQELAA